MDLQTMNDCAGTDPGLPTARTDPVRHYQLAVAYSRPYQSSNS